MVWIGWEDGEAVWEIGGYVILAGLGLYMVLGPGK